MNTSFNIIAFYDLVGNFFCCACCCFWLNSRGLKKSGRSRTPSKRLTGEAWAATALDLVESLPQANAETVPAIDNFHGDVASDTLQNLLMQGESLEANSSQIPSLSTLPFTNTSFDEISLLMSDATMAKNICGIFFNLRQLVPKDKKAKSSKISLRLTALGL